MKKTKVIIPALGILLLSTAASVTGTVAWFSANATVTADGMKIKGKAEAGIAIAAYPTNGVSGTIAATDYSDAATSTAPAGDKILPTWSMDGTNWFHAASTETADGQAISNKGYEKLSSGFENYYQLSKFSMKATGDLKSDVYVQSIEVTGDLADSAYDESLRVLVSTAEGVFVFAPNRTAAITEKLDKTASDTDPIADDTYTLDTIVTYTDANIILSNLDKTAKDVSVYVYFDGEDPSCCSDEIPAEWVDLAVTIKFGSNQVTPAEPDPANP